MKHFTVIELGRDADSPMIGTFDNVTNDQIGKDLFTERLMTALNEHFDPFENLDVPMIPSLFEYKTYTDVCITVDGDKRKIRIMETWIY